MTKIKNGDNVSVHYTGKLEDGSVFDTSLAEGREPLTVTLGQGQLIPGFENGLIDMTVGEMKTIEIEPENAYGDIKPQMVSEVPLSQVPEGVKAGDMLQGQNQFGPVNVVVTEVKESTAVLDMNHPLAGKKLIFDLEVVSVN
jgi:FKBP-type peptidyl-prolyl cis-trans isomerase SlpA|tara:strand:- start:172 stop:597 length:426 start_codon:yes stop_codon:yes gene_type:complete